MELKDFVAKTLSEIIEGVIVSQQNVQDKGAIISPAQMAMLGGVLMSAPTGHQSVQLVDFDISLTEIQSGEVKGGIGVFFGSVGLGTQGKSETENSAMNRVKFSVPIIFPKQNKFT